MVSSSKRHLGQRYSLLDKKRPVLLRTARGGTLTLILTPDVIPRLELRGGGSAQGMG